MRDWLSWLTKRDLRHVVIFYLIITAVIIGVLAPIYHYADDMFVSSELAQYQTTLDNGAGELSSIVSGISNANYFTRRGDSFLSLRYSAEGQLNPVTLMEQQNILKGYFVQQSAILEAGLLFAEDLVLSTTWVFYPGVSVSYYPDMFHCVGLSFDEWHRLLRGNGSGFLPAADYTLRSKGAFRAVVYTMPWLNDGIMYALIPVEKLEALFLPRGAAQEISVSLRATDGTLLCAFGPEQTQPDAYTLSADIIGGGAGVTISIPRAVVNHRLHALRRLVLIYLGSVLLVAITLTVLFAGFTTAKPLNSLSHTLPGVQEADRSLPDVYRALSDGILSMDRTIADQQATIASHYLDLALARGFLSAEERTRLHELFPALPQRCRLVLYRLAPEESRRPEAVAMCRAAFPDCPLLPVDHDGILLVLDAEHNHREEAARLLEEMNTALGGGVRAIASGVEEGVDGLHTAWQQLMDIESSVPLSAFDHLCTSRDLPETRTVMPLSMQDLQTIYSALACANATLALSILENCTNALLLREDNAPLYHHSYLMLQQMLRQLQLENPAALGALHIPGWSSRERNELFASRLPACFEQIAQQMRIERSAASRNTADDVLAYIHQNLSSASLCVDSVASHFGISSTTLQKLCKEATGMTVAAYVEMQRLSRAYEMLTETRAPIAQVAEACGFNSPNSFYKAFKRYYGMAPRSISDPLPNQEAES